MTKEISLMKNIKEENMGSMRHYIVWEFRITLLKDIIFSEAVTDEFGGKI